MTSEAAPPGLLRGPLDALKGIGPARARDLASSGVETPLDLLLHLPFRYEDRSRLARIADLAPGSPAATVGGTVLSARLVRTRRPGFTIFEAVLDDGTASARLVFFNQPWLARWMTPGTRLFVFGAPGETGRGRRGVVLENPAVEADVDDPDSSLSVGRVVPIYRKLRGLQPRLRRRLVAGLLDAADRELPERLPAALRAAHGLPTLADSLREAHFPGSAGGDPDPEAFVERRSPHLSRLVLEELLELQVGLLLRRRQRRHVPGPLLAATPEIRRRLASLLPFALTPAQRRAIRQIGADLRSGRPMSRFLHGDVGTGKTIVAVLTALLSASCGWQTAFLAPTEVLAEQHAASVFRLLRGTEFTPALLTARVRGRPRRALLAALAAGEVQIVVGTHALLTDPGAFRRLGLVVVDEQHRFGVAQRAVLGTREGPGGERPHVLVMSATPIPRSLALALYGDMDVSTLDERPPGRSPVATRVLPEAARREVLAEVDAEVARGGQAYVVVPLVEESESVEARAAERHAEDLRRALPGRRVAVVHGRLSGEEREAAMSAFAGGSVDVLVATTVIEVGVDVPNASFLVVENAERFGLAQLHQLRGRVGRGSRPSRCVFLAGEAATAEALDRLDVLVRTDDGFVVAEEDLKRRGPGDFLGTRQSGVPFLRVANVVLDVGWLRVARDVAAGLVDSGREGPFAEPLFLRRTASDG